MSSRAIREHQGKLILHNNLNQFFNAINETMQLKFNQADTAQKIKETVSSFETLPSTQSYIAKYPKLVVKLDQLLKRRGKNNLVLLRVSWSEVKEWICRIAGTTIQVGNIKGTALVFLIEPFVEHLHEDEYYLCIRSKKD